MAKFTGHTSNGNGADMSDDLVKRGRDHAELLRKMDEVCEPRRVSTPSQKLLLAMADEIERLQGTALYRAFKAMRKDRDKRLRRAEAAEVRAENFIRFLRAAEAREAKLRKALDWALPLAELTLEQSRTTRLLNGHTDIGAGTEYPGLWPDEVQKRDEARQALTETEDPA